DLSVNLADAGGVTDDVCKQLLASTRLEDNVPAQVRILCRSYLLSGGFSYAFALEFGGPGREGRCPPEASLCFAAKQANGCEICQGGASTSCIPPPPYAGCLGSAICDELGYLVNCYNICGSGDCAQNSSCVTVSSGPGGGCTPVPNGTP